MFAAFLINIEPSCRGITGDSIVTTIIRKTGLAFPGGKLKSGESAEIALIRKVKEEINAEISNPIHIYTGIVDNETIGAYTAKIINIDNHGYETINQLLISQADLQIRRWCVEALVAAGLNIHTLSQFAWIACFGSGTLQYSYAMGDKVKCKSMYLHERSAFELFGAECIPSSRIMTGPPLAVQDSPQWTEALWETRRLRIIWSIMRNNGSISPQWICVSDENEKWEGLGLSIPISKNDINWWPDGHSAVIKLAEYKNGKFSNNH